LLSRVSNYLDKLERREQSLIAKCDLQEGRLSQGDNDRSSSGLAGRGRAQEKVGNQLDALQELKMKQIRQKKDRLSYAVDRLNLEAQHRERQLRMSMAAPQQYDDTNDF